ncbi:MAG: ASCH domain-containing protein [Bacteroidetes bacterium]|nr:ASCH domain-containing protein [Bacteroidota bacterium]
MKALSVAQPWAGMIMDGVKDIEIRTWAPKNSRLPMRIAIISCKQPSGIKPYLDPNMPGVVRPGIGTLTPQFYIYNHPGIMPRGYILGDVLLTEIKTYHDVETWRADRERHRVPGSLFKPGILGWKLEDPRKLTRPRPYRGRLSLYEIPDSELDRLYDD